MLFSSAARLVVIAGLAVTGHCKSKKHDGGWETRYTATGARAVAKAAATAKTTSPTSNVEGKAFDRLAIIYFENQNYDKAYGDPNFSWFTKKGITLSNYYAVTHPSQPNYMASIAGDYFGMENDSFGRAPRNVSTVIDLLESKGISWGHYQEDMPYSGFEGMHWRNQANGANDYERKHNPAILHDSVTHSEQRLSQIKNLSMTHTARSMFHRDLEADELPQWMFITPNMTSDGHDSSVTTAGEWCRAFLEPLLEDKRFMRRTLVLITWDENETYTVRNKVLGILLGDAIPQHYVGTEDKHFYTHYSQISTVSANWDLPTLGRWDVGANVLSWVAERTGDVLRKWSSEQALQARYWNYSYAGYFNEQGGNARIPAPNLALDKSHAGRPILPAIREAWAGSRAPTYYKDTIQVADGLKPPRGYAPVHR
ncbi:phosphoesterase family protein [Hirsutella rhossiliensis]|uniref:Phosphoesterase family domain-containing protein n=1 Tax=Hirsutella rhossiliensis TaxID=111463 RepID=A0A9P8MZU9_9HYPO|nr:phosphoesterase family domain-containing protein [Hirsutella rhossiliensis]KAH0963311.1 phosphoesterase family domain-containing protein [Hirsutella rhossiliensis]